MSGADGERQSMRGFAGTAEAERPAPSPQLVSRPARGSVPVTATAATAHGYLCRWHPVKDFRALRGRAVEAIVSAAVTAIRDRGQFHLVLAGGNTPREIYRELANARAKWSEWHIYFGDERCLPQDDPGRNSRMTAEDWLDSVPIPKAQVHVIPAELGARGAAQMYAQLLQHVGEFDLVLLGLGEDGHSASLFPGHDWGIEPESPAMLAVYDAPKPPLQRVSMSAARLSRARQVIFLVSGEPKRQAVAAWRAGEDIPARAITPEAGVDVLVESGLLASLAP